MNKEQRIAHLSELEDKAEAYGSREIWYKSKRQKRPVFEIGLDYLIYNAYNGRIASFVKTYERQTGKVLDASNAEDAAVIERFLWESNEPSNKETKKSLKEKGQLEYGLVTRDGVIIDGNRRAMLIKQVAAERAESPAYFLAVILDETLDQNPKEIMRLETTYQMGEDAKVDYSPIEKYLKCKDLKSYGFEEKEIGKMMGESEAEVKDYLSIMELMDDYLAKLGYAGMYTRLDKTEGAFVDVNSYLKRYIDKKSAAVTWNYKDTDLEELKLIYFDYIQFMYNKGKKDDGSGGVFGAEDSKDYRLIGKPSKKESLFCTSQNIWETFRNHHFNRVDPIRAEFIDGEFNVGKLREKFPEIPLADLLKQRDVVWAEKAGPMLKGNLGKARNDLQNHNSQNEPEALLEKALAALRAIDTGVSAFCDNPEVERLVSEINSLAWDFKQLIKKNRRDQVDSP